MYNKQNALKDVADYWRKVKSGELPAPSPNDIDFTIWTAEAAIRRIAELEAKTAMTMGVGSGNGNLFVHGDYDSIKAAQAIVFENESLRAKLATPVRLPTKPQPTGQYEHDKIAFHRASAIDNCALAIRAAGFTVEGDE